MEIVIAVAVLAGIVLFVRGNRLVAVLTVLGALGLYYLATR
jgi:hypothetical protein